MSLIGTIIQNVKRWFEHELFLKINGIKKPKEVLVIVAKTGRRRPRSSDMRNGMHRRY